MKLRALAIVEIEVDDVQSKLCASSCSWLRDYRKHTPSHGSSCTLYERVLQHDREKNTLTRLPECRERSSSMLNPGG